MIYTIGCTKNYERYFREQRHPQKKGADPADDYLGGSVWLTKEEAEEIAPYGYSVYGVLADWDTDTLPIANSNERRLQKDSYLIRLGFTQSHFLEERINHGYGIG